MAVDPVPWFVGGGAQHSPEVARVLAYAAFRGNEGVLGLGDLKVLALAVPGNNVRVMPGVGSILNRAAGGAYQAYAGRVVSEEPVPVGATGSGGGRSDLVVFRVEDPYMPGEPWQDPPDPTAGPYIFPRVIAGVPAATRTVAGLGLGYSAIPLARIDIPPSTATITDAMIVDLRTIANPRRERVVKTGNPSRDFDLTAVAYGGAWTDAGFTVEVPAWAARAIVRTSIQGVAVYVGIAFGGIRTKLGTVASQGTGFDESVPNGADIDRKHWRDADTLTIPAAMRGTTQPVILEAYRNPASTAIVRAGVATSLDFDIEFLEAAA